MVAGEIGRGLIQCSFMPDKFVRFTGLRAIQLENQVFELAGATGRYTNQEKSGAGEASFELLEGNDSYTVLVLSETDDVLVAGRKRLELAGEAHTGYVINSRAGRWRRLILVLW